MTNYLTEPAIKLAQTLFDAIAPAFAKLAVASISAANLRQLMEDDRFKKSEAVINNDELSKDEKNLQLPDITLSHEERIKFCNLRTIFEKTEQYLGDTFDASNFVPAMSEDWKDQFKTFAELKSDEHVQDLWARLLAGEIQNHRHFDFKTMQILSYLSSEDAKALNALGQFTHSNNRIYLPKFIQDGASGEARHSTLDGLLRIFKTHGIEKQNLKMLEEFGVLMCIPDEFDDDPKYHYRTSFIPFLALVDTITFTKQGQKLITLTNGYGASSFPNQYWKELIEFCSDDTCIEVIKNNDHLKLSLSAELHQAIKDNF